MIQIFLLFLTIYFISIVLFTAYYSISILNNLTTNEKFKSNSLILVHIKKIQYLLKWIKFKNSYSIVTPLIENCQLLIKIIKFMFPNSTNIIVSKIITMKYSKILFFF